MNLNYHEMTMNEPRDSPARRKQFLVICTVMAGAFVYSLTSAGGLTPVLVQTKVIGPSGDERPVYCPGGDLIYKLAKRDYAASQSMALDIGKDANLSNPEVDFPDRMYTFYLDDARSLNGFLQRFAVGYLVTNHEDAEANQAYQNLMAKKQEYEEKKTGTSKKIRAQVTVTKEDLKGPVTDLWPKLPYETIQLPQDSVPCGMVNFPYTGGFVSALILQYKILPAMRNSAGSNSVIISTCSPREQMCTHYATLTNKDEEDVYLLGRPNTETYQSQVAPEENFIIDWKGMRDMVSPLLPFLKPKEETVKAEDDVKDDQATTDEL